MECTDIQKGLSSFVERYDSQTYLGSYRETTRASLLKDGLSTRANSLWKMAEYVIAEYDNDDKTPIEKYLNGWKSLASRIGNQYLLLEVAHNSWSMYDSKGDKLGDEEYIKKFFDSKRNLIETQDHQVIYFGAPGTGKSYAARKLTKNKPHIRTIFHPDSDYASFVGCYKPVMEGDQIKYKYRAQAFVNAYINAWLTDEPYYLVIEEINRGNCAQIFGDIFQLLDRTDGESEYEVHPDTDLQKYIADEFDKPENQQALADKSGITPDEIVSGKVMRLPQNLNIIATMNTSDQSLFPMDSAFKRRWNWKYFSIKDESKGFVIKLNEGGQEYDWWKTIAALNEKILAITKSADKQLGYWFAKLPEGQTVISAEQFVSKVIFYLWNDVFKDYNFGDNNAFTPETTFDKFFDSKGEIIEDTIVTFMERNYPKDETTKE